MAHLRPLVLAFGVLASPTAADMRLGGDEDAGVRVRSPADVDVRSAARLLIVPGRGAVIRVCTPEDTEGTPCLRPLTRREDEEEGSAADAELRIRLVPAGIGAVGAGRQVLMRSLNDRMSDFELRMTGAPVDVTLTPLRSGLMNVTIKDAVARAESWLIGPSAITEGPMFAAPGGTPALSVSVTLAPLGTISIGQ